MALVRRKAVIAVLIAVIIVSSSFAVLDYFYTHQTDFNGVYKISPDGYYSGKPLPQAFSVPAFSYGYNLGGNLTAHYNLVKFPYTVWENKSFGQFKFGVTYGFYPNGSENLVGIPFNSEVSPRIWIGLISAHYNYSGFLGIKTLGMTAYSSLPYVSPINYGNVSNPSLWRMYYVNESANLNSRQMYINTLGNVYFIHPVNQFVTPNESLYTLNSGQYFLELTLDLYAITFLGTHFLSEMTITEPWVHIT